MSKKPKRKLTDRELAEKYILKLWGEIYLTNLEQRRAYDGYLAGLRAGRREKP